MKISETLQKSSPLIPKREMSKTEYMKLVDANTELVDKMNDLQERIDKAIEYKNQLLFDLNRQYITFEKWEEILEPFENILKGSDYSPRERKRVAQYTLDDKFVREFRSINEAGRETNSSIGNIRNCCVGISHTCNGYKWRFVLDKGE